LNFAVFAKFVPVPFCPVFKYSEGQSRDSHEFRKGGEIRSSPGFAMGEAWKALDTPPRGRLTIGLRLYKLPHTLFLQPRGPVEDHGERDGAADTLMADPAFGWLGWRVRCRCIPT
jgi:hypothetical protein